MLSSKEYFRLVKLEAFQMQIAAEAGEALTSGLSSFACTQRLCTEALQGISGTER